MSGVTKDVTPFTLLAGGYRSGLSGLNIVGLKRSGFKHSGITRLKEIYRLLLQDSGKREDRLQQAESLLTADDAAARSMIAFVRTAKHGLMMHGRDGD